MTLRAMLSRAMLSLIPGYNTGSSVIDYGLDYYSIPKYPSNLSADDYLQMYKENGLATRIVDSYPNECWKKFPNVQEGEGAGTSAFEKAWKELITDPFLNLPFNLLKADRLSGIGRFGIIFLGLDDGNKLDAPVTKAQKLLFTRAFCEPYVSVDQADLVTDKSNPRFGLPEFYKIKFSVTSGSVMDTKVHWSRVIHLVENPIEDNIYGSSRMSGLVPRIMDTNLLMSGSTHMFMRGGFPGFAFEADADVEITPENETKMKAQIDEYVHSLTRYLTLQGVKSKAMEVQVASPEPYIRAQLQFISIATGIPLRLLVGSEQAQLASSQDRSNFDERVQARQEYYLTPSFILPFIQRLQLLTVLPPSSSPILCQWVKDDLNAKKERSTISVSLSEALQRYSSTPMAVDIMPPRSFMSIILGMTPEQIDAVQKDQSDDELELIPSSEDVPLNKTEENKTEESNTDGQK